MDERPTRPAPMSGWRWDHSYVRRLSKEQRLKVEALLAAGKSGKRITAIMGFPIPLWVGAVKKNPYPGGKLDPKANLAKYEGRFLDWDGMMYEYRGLKDGKPVRGALLSSLKQLKRGAAKRKHGSVLDGNAVVEATDASASKVPRDPGHKRKPQTVVPFAKPKPKPEDPRARGSIDSAPKRGARASALPPDGAVDGAAAAEDFGEPLPETDRPHARHTAKGGGPATLRKARTYTRKHAPMEERIKVLAECMKDQGAPWSARLSAVSELNAIDGLQQATKASIDGAIGSAPLFALPRGAGVGVAPVVAPESERLGPGAEEDGAGPEPMDEPEPDSSEP